jgi:PPP family 3-phenylpropionic acid transporter
MQGEDAGRVGSNAASPLDPSGPLLGVVYFFSFTVLGAVVPYLALELRRHGVEGKYLVFTMAALPFGRFVAGPAWSVLADWLQASGTVLRMATVVAVLGAVLLVLGELVANGQLDWVPRELWVQGGTVLAVTVWAAGRAPMGPLVDTMAMKAGARRYGQLRRWGSVGFLVAVFVTGFLREDLGVSPLQVGLLLAVALVVVVHRLPRGGAVGRTALGPALRILAADRPLWVLLLAAAFHFAGHVGSTSFLAVHMDALGLGSRWVGAALATGVIVEIVIMSYAGPLFERFGAGRLYLLAMAVAVPRWMLTAVVTDPWALVALQSLHGITFGCFWLSGVALVTQRAPKQVANSAQAAFSAAVGGLGALLGMAGGSVVIETSPTHHLFWWGALLGTVALVLAVWAVPRLGGDDCV